MRVGASPQPIFALSRVRRRINYLRDDFHYEITDFAFLFTAFKYVLQAVIPCSSQ